MSGVDPSGGGRGDASPHTVVAAGALERLPGLLAERVGAARYAVITDSNVAELHAAGLVERLHAAGRTAVLLVFPAGEASKTRETWARLTDEMLGHGLGRDSCVLAVGGGVTADLAGFVAATYMRGVPLVNVPTSLLAMIDAAVGGKTGVDTAAGKNLVGAFHDPVAVIADPLVLRTLPPAQLRAGLAEAVKHGAALDAAYFEWIVQHAGSLLSMDSAAIEHLVRHSIHLKSGVVADDPREAGLRAVLNFGHTVAHALEVCSGYALPHGHAVAIGMIAEAELGERAGLTRSGCAARITAALQACELPVRTTADADALIAAMTHDKKARRSAPRFTLLAEIGRCATDAAGAWTHELPHDLLRRVLAEVIPGIHAV